MLVSRSVTIAASIGMGKHSTLSPDARGRALDKAYLDLPIKPIRIALDPNKWLYRLLLGVFGRSMYPLKSELCMRTLYKASGWNVQKCCLHAMSCLEGQGDLVRKSITPTIPIPIW